MSGLFLHEIVHLLLTCICYHFFFQYFLRTQSLGVKQGRSNVGMRGSITLSQYLEASYFDGFFSVPIVCSDSNY